MTIAYLINSASQQRMMRIVISCPSKRRIGSSYVHSRHVNVRQLKGPAESKRGPVNSSMGIGARSFKSKPIGRNRRQKTTLSAQSASSRPATEKSVPRLGERLNVMLNKPRTIPVPRWVSPRHYTTTLSECFGHSSFILVALAYAVDDFLQLRIIAIAGSTAMLVFTYFHPHGRVLWLPFKWNFLFIAINSYRIGKVYVDRYLAEQISQKMREIHDEHFYVMDTVDFARLLRLGETETYKQGEVIVAQGERNRYIRLVIDGELKILRDGQLTYLLHEGNFISETGLHAGLLLRGKVESSCSIVANSDDVAVLRWDRTELMHLLDVDSSIRRALKAVLSWDIVSKLKSQRVILTSGMIENPEEWTKLRREQGQHRYAAILHNVLSEPKYLQHRDELNKYRNIHHIDDKVHEAALKQIGWTLAEFEAGVKDGQEIKDDDNEIQTTGVQWYVRDLYYRVFG